MSLSSSLKACFAFSRLLQLRLDLSGSGLVSSSSCGSRCCPVELERRRGSAAGPTILRVFSALHSRQCPVLSLLPGSQPFRGQAQLFQCPSQGSEENGAAMHRGSSLSPAGALLPLQEPLLQRLGSLQYVTILTSTRLRFQEGHRHWDGTRGYRRRVRLWLRRLWLRL